uniref:Serpentine receptor class gamma n=1 Tax=Caenorhabditis tropicalis TaxID=1561998 RepID=A0A1I7URU0_9PELO
MFILYHIRYNLISGNLLEFFFNYEMRRVVISTALVQFTFIFTFERIIKFFSTDLKNVIERTSIVTPTAPEVYLQELNNM